MSIQQLFFNSGAADKIVATGGTVYTEGNYKVHVFSSTGTFAVSEINDANATLDVIVVGGGYIGNPGGDSLFDFDGRDGGLGGTGGFSRAYSSLTFGSYFNVANYTATVGAANTNDSQLNNKTASPFICTSGNAAKQGGSGGSGAPYNSETEICANSTAGALGQGGYSLNWLSGNLGIIYYAGGGSGGGGGGSAGGCLASAGGAGTEGVGAGGAGGNFYTAGSAGGNATQPGAGGGGGGGAGSNNEDGNFIPGGAAGLGKSGVIYIRYLFK